MKKFEEYLDEFDNMFMTSKEIDVSKILNGIYVHNHQGGIINNLFDVKGEHKEEYYKWQFIYAYVKLGLCPTENIGVEISLPKGNAKSADIRMDGVVFDDSTWINHYIDFHNKKDKDTCKWDELEWLENFWQIIKERSDVKFFILTKRPERILESLSKDWNDGYENVILNVTCENQQKADERIPILLSIPAKHKGIMCAPFLEEIHIEKYLETKQLEQVMCGGENYEGARPCHYEWVQSLSAQCEMYKTNFNFFETGTIFYKEGKKFFIPKKHTQSEQAFKSKLNKKFYDLEFVLKDKDGNILNKEELYKLLYNKNTCVTCGGRQTCNGCSNCEKCKDVLLITKEELEELEKRV